MTSHVIATLRERGYRITLVRKALVDFLETQDAPVAVQAIMEGLVAKKLSPNKTTIYRELEVLAREGLLREVSFGGNRRLYELAGDDHHHHVVCVQCEAVQDIELSHEASAQKSLVEKKTSFKIFNHTMDFFGLCGKCQAR